MTIQQMNYFIEACRCGNITTAAEHLFISPSGLRLALHRIEQELGCRLLDWNAGGVRPTEDGIFFLKNASEICRLYGECEERFGLRVSEPNVVKVAIGEHFPNLFVTSLMAAFNRSDGKYRADYKDFYDAQTAVGDGSAEMGFDTGPVDRKNFICTPILSYPIFAVVSEAGDLGGYDTLPPECLDGREVILNEKRSRNREFFSACRKCGVTPVPTDIVGRELTVFFGVQINPHRVGITNVESAEAVAIPGIRAIPIGDPAFREEIYMFRKRGDYAAPAVEQLERFCLKELEQLTDDERPAAGRRRPE